jgi:hypothetical protein
MSLGWTLGALGLVLMAFGCSSTSGGSGKDASVGEDGGRRDASAGPPGCVVVTGTGADQKCIYEPSDGGCSEDGATFSTCPTANLFGCCANVLSDAGGECPDVPGDGGTATALCYYSDSGTVQQAASNCSTDGYMGSPCNWQLTPTGPN